MIDYNKAKELTLEVFQEMDWEQLNLIVEELKRKCGVTKIEKIFPGNIVFTNLEHGRVMAVTSGTIIISNEEGKKIETKLSEESPNIAIDLINKLNNGSENATEEEFKKSVRSELIHEFTHLISNKEPIDVHGNFEDMDHPHAITRTGIAEDYIYGLFEDRKGFYGRLNEVLTELVAGYLETRFQPKENYQNEKKFGGYIDFVEAFGVWLIGASKAFGVNPQDLVKSFFVHYFEPDRTPIVTEEFVTTMPEDLQYGFWELLKPETDQNIIREYFRHIVREYNIQKSEIDNVQQYYKNIDPQNLTPETTKYPRTLEDYLNLITEAFQDLNWEEVNRIGVKIQTQAGVANIRIVIPKQIIFQKLAQGRDFQVNQENSFGWNDRNIRVKHYSLNFTPDIICDPEHYFNNKSWEYCPSEEFKQHITDSLIHEFAHLISQNEPLQIHDDVTVKDVAHTVLRGGVKTTEVFSPENVKTDIVRIDNRVAGRLNEVLTELVAELIHQEYPGPNKSKYRSGSYHNFKVMYNVIAISISRIINQHDGMHITPQEIKKSLLYAYFTTGDVTSDAFVNSLPQDVQLAYLELMKPELDEFKPEWEYVQYLTSKYNIPRQELSATAYQGEK